MTDAPTFGERAFEAARRATHDPETGLPNHYLLSDRIKVAVAQAKRSGHLTAVVVIDLNKTVEHRAALGLDAGGTLTAMVSDHLELFSRKSDTLAYIGSDLFAIVMPQVRSLPQIQGLTSRIMKLFDGPWELAGQSLHLSPGVGVSYFPENGEAAEELLTHAIAAAARAGREGAREPVLADPVWHEEARRRLTLEADLRRALEGDELFLLYQPQVDIETGCTSGFEALIRWQHPERGLISPNEFIPLAEETHLISPIGEWVLEQTCAQLASWRRAGWDEVRAAVNLAAEQLVGGRLLDLVGAALARHELRPGQLEVEITERTVIADIAATASTIAALKELGVLVTMDDFGTGHSSLAVLAAYPFDTLKIDRSFVIRSLDTAKDRTLMAALISLAHDIGMTVVAEGVETREQLLLLRTLGADEVQGFFYARPLPPEECEPFLSGRCDVETGGPT